MGKIGDVSARRGCSLRSRRQAHAGSRSLAAVARANGDDAVHLVAQSVGYTRRINGNWMDTSAGAPFWTATLRHSPPRRTRHMCLDEAIRQVARTDGGGASLLVVRVSASAPLSSRRANTNGPGRKIRRSKSGRQARYVSKTGARDSWAHR
ncbi:hypothetical protein BDY17DRAFT_67764 [Neohortaea acidophila]|uniref:Uncharacterized protein n=1 Tax=Neohortaea acidophila TaxID=245834 RepID=A0A6A6Q0K7_9PEZI|nr:uncharacterized protein BDY17DRAFT_67764 [Neohortaea acidophila]KAF2485940.1 hypothetical protein BDY17DRAFT_67764 [Neohortaea acidophila]